MAENNMNELFEQLDKLLNQTDLTDVSSESSGFTQLPDGYYLCELEKAELKFSKSSGQPMASLQFTVVEDGTTAEMTEQGTVIQETLKRTKGRKIFVHYILNSEQKIKRFATDMLKFEEKEGESLLPKEAFTTSETLVDALDLLCGMRIYVNVSTTVNNDTSFSVTFLSQAISPAPTIENTLNQIPVGEPLPSFGTVRSI